MVLAYTLPTKAPNGVYEAFINDAGEEVHRGIDGNNKFLSVLGVEESAPHSAVLTGSTSVAVSQRVFGIPSTDVAAGRVSLYRGWEVVDWRLDRVDVNHGDCDAAVDALKGQLCCSMSLAVFATSTGVQILLNAEDMPSLRRNRNPRSSIPPNERKLSMNLLQLGTGSNKQISANYSWYSIRGSVVRTTPLHFSICH